MQDAYFFLGRSAAIRDCAERVLPAWDRDNPLAGFVLGLYAFGLEETGDLKRAEDFGREALARNPRDAWATHALAHVMETANRHEEGVAFLKSTRGDWAHAHFMAHHNGWHLALFLIEQGRFDEVLADYDRFTAPKLADDATLDRVDASSLLWRLELAGVDVGDRWAPVANTWMAHVDDHLLAFNDLHCAFAAARSPDPDHAARLRQSLDEYERSGSGENRQVTSEIGRRLIDGALAFAAGDYERAVDAILPVRHDAARIGGSHAQRDVINLTLIAAARTLGTAEPGAGAARRTRPIGAESTSDGVRRSGQWNLTTTSIAASDAIYQYFTNLRLFRPATCVTPMPHRRKMVNKRR